MQSHEPFVLHISLLAFLSAVKFDTFRTGIYALQSSIVAAQAENGGKVYLSSQAVPADVQQALHLVGAHFTLAGHVEVVSKVSWQLGVQTIL